MNRRLDLRLVGDKRFLKGFFIVDSLNNSATKVEK